MRIVRLGAFTLGFLGVAFASAGGGKPIAKLRDFAEVAEEALGKVRTDPMWLRAKGALQGGIKWSSLTHAAQPLETVEKLEDAMNDVTGLLSVNALKRLWGHNVLWESGMSALNELGAVLMKLLDEVDHLNEVSAIARKNGDRATLAKLDLEHSQVLETTRGVRNSAELVKAAGNAFADFLRQLDVMEFKYKDIATLFGSPRHEEKAFSVEVKPPAYVKEDAAYVEEDDAKSIEQPQIAQSDPPLVTRATELIKTLRQILDSSHWGSLDGYRILPKAIEATETIIGILTKFVETRNSAIDLAALRKVAAIHQNFKFGCMERAKRDGFDWDSDLLNDIEKAMADIRNFEKDFGHVDELKSIEQSESQGKGVAAGGLVSQGNDLLRALEKLRNDRFWTFSDKTSSSLEAAVTKTDKLIKILTTFVDRKQLSTIDDNALKLLNDNMLHTQYLLGFSARAGDRSKMEKPVDMDLYNREQATVTDDIDKAMKQLKPFADALKMASLSG